MDQSVMKGFISVEVIRNHTSNIYEGIVVGAKECRRLNARRKTVGEIGDKVINTALERLINGEIEFEYQEPEKEKEYHRAETLRTYTSRSGKITLNEG